MGLFDAFSADSGTSAARQGYRSRKQGLGEARDEVQEYGGLSRDAITAGQTQATGAYTNAYNTGRSDLTSAYDQGYERLGENADIAAGYLQQGMAPYQGLFDRGEAGVDAYWNLLTNPNAYSLSPAAQWQMQQGLEALNRQAAGRGMLSAGNNTQDILDYSQGVAEQDRRAELGMYDPYFGLYGQGAQGLSSGYRGLGDLYAQLGRDQSGYLQNRGQDLARLGQWYGNNMGNTFRETGARIGSQYESQGNTLADLQRQKGEAGYQYAADKYAAEQTANKNMWDAILGAGTAAAKIYAGA